MVVYLVVAVLGLAILALVWYFMGVLARVPLVLQQVRCVLNMHGESLIKGNLLTPEQIEHLQRMHGLNHTKH